MNRTLWFTAGAGAGIYAAFRARRAAELLTVDGWRDRVGAAVVGARIARDEIALGRAEAETQLRERIGVRLDGLQTQHGSAPRLGAAPTPPTTPRPTAPAQQEESN